MTATGNGPSGTPARLRLTPERVRKMQFTRTQIGRRGLAEEEVQHFLERVAEDIAARDAENASMRAMVLHYQTTLADWRAGPRILGAGRRRRRPRRTRARRSTSCPGRSRRPTPTWPRPMHTAAAWRSTHASMPSGSSPTHSPRPSSADRAVQGYRARSGNGYTPGFEELERRLASARTFLTSLETVQAQLRTAREALSCEFDRLGSTGPRPRF